MKEVFGFMGAGKNKMDTEASCNYAKEKNYEAHFPIFLMDAFDIYLYASIAGSMGANKSI